MAEEVVLSGPSNGNMKLLTKYDSISTVLDLSLEFALGEVVRVVIGGGGSVTGTPAQVPMNQMKGSVEVSNAHTLAGVRFSLANQLHVVKSDGTIQYQINPSTGNGTEVGQLVSGMIFINNWPSAPAAMAVTNFRGLAMAPQEGPFSPYGDAHVTFRTATAPLRTSSLNILGSMRDETTFNVTANDDGIINSTRVKGRVNYNTGVVDLFFVSPTALVPGQTAVSLAHLNIPGVNNVFLDLARSESLRYNAVAFSYLPLNSELLGIDPVRLPSDGRVPIFAPGYVLVFGRAKTTAPATQANGSVVTAPEERLSHARFIDANGQVIHTGYNVDLDEGTVTVTNNAGWVQPVRLEWRIEDMVQCRDAQINGDVTFLPALSHAYPADGDSYCSSALAFGDLIARVPFVFDLTTFDPTFSDVPGVGAPNAQFDDTNAPIEVTNAGAVTTSWALVFTSTTQYRVMSKHLGQIDVGTTGADCAPINPNTGEPYFLVPKEGWGLGWNTGNTLRFNTVACGHAAWIVRTVRQGPATAPDYNFELLPRGGIDNPL